ncbi:DUF5416 family protein [Campylobacter jejuni]|nr:DUF5416 family protein [Campylobacter jejuni]WLQ93718.1 DUF5416 family protein [Campylobacter jejuni]WLR07950.1 DUF5416 family protein [Campylobacter jejuni]WLR09342.1 DUF5416 family protein [Campylobacter jejuni]WLR10791.1 DUF5416 family protein [Campylobacter jejuni]
MFFKNFKNENFLSDFKESKQEVVTIKKHEKLEILKIYLKKIKKLALLKLKF